MASSQNSADSSSLGGSSVARPTSRLTVASGEWRVASGEWRVASGEWRVASGEWRVASGEWRENQRSPRPPLRSCSLATRHSPLRPLVAASSSVPGPPLDSPGGELGPSGLIAVACAARSQDGAGRRAIPVPTNCCPTTMTGGRDIPARARFPTDIHSSRCPFHLMQTR